MSLKNRKRQYKMFMDRGETALAKNQLHPKFPEIGEAKEEPKEEEKSKSKKGK